MSCLEAPGLVIEKNRLKGIGGNFLGIIGDANHSFGYHLCAPPSGDYSTRGTANMPVGSYSCAIDIGMNWQASRQWLAWLITEIRDDRITGIAEVIGSLDGRNVRYWSDSSGWHQNGTTYTGSGHDTWTHVSIYRSTALADHKILAGWTATGKTPTGGSSSEAPVANGFDAIKDVILYNTKEGTRLGDVWGSTLGELRTLRKTTDTVAADLRALAERLDAQGGQEIDYDKLARALLKVLAES